MAVARRITRPITTLIAATRAMVSGDRAARAGQLRAPGELRDLAAAFGQMADTIDREDQIRRDLVAGVAHELRTLIAVLPAGHEALLWEWVSQQARNLLMNLSDHPTASSSSSWTGTPSSPPRSTPCSRQPGSGSSRHPYQRPARTRSRNAVSPAPAASAWTGC
jgi:hypothetical protein